MELRQLDVDYEQALQWIAEYTESKVFNKDKVNIARMKRERELDVSRVYYFPKSLHYKNSGNYYFAGWENSQPSCYIQGDMDGGGFLQPFWNAFAIKRNEDLATLMQLSELRFGYVNDKNERCSVAIIYNLLDPKKYMVSVLKNAEDPMFENRKVNLFFSEYFCKDVTLGQCIDSKNIGNRLKDLLNSSLLATELKNVFTEDGVVNIANAEKFSKTQLKYGGTEKQIVEEQEKKENIVFENPPPASIIKPVTSTHHRKNYGGAFGAATAYLIGICIVALALVFFAFSFPLIIVPVACVFLGIMIDAALFHYCSMSRTVRNDSIEEKEIPHKMASEHSYSRMARFGVRNQHSPIIKVQDDKPFVESTQNAGDISTKQRYSPAKPLLTKCGRGRST